jgi:hypothetical protein
MTGAAQRLDDRDGVTAFGYNHFLMLLGEFQLE